MDKGISFRRLHTSHAFHSQMMDPILEPFTSYIGKIALRPPKVPYISGITGTWITDREAANPAYWAQHIRQTVRFAEGIQLQLSNPTMVLLEVGPGHALSTLARRVGAVGARTGAVGARTGAVGAIPCGRPVPTILASLPHPQAPVSDRAFLLNTCGRLWCAGVIIDWSQLHAGLQRRRIPLPTYPFERQRYWISPIGAGQAQGTVTAARGDRPGERHLHKEPDLAQWFSVPSWKRSLLPSMQILPVWGDGD